MRLTNSGSTLLAALYAVLFLLLSPSGSAAASGSASYQTPTITELRQGEQLFGWLFARQSLNLARDSATALGFSWQETASHIRLQDVSKKGWGDYHFSKLDSSGITLQSPHRYHDKHTGVIAGKLFAQGGFTAIALNSLSRRTPVDYRPTLPADLARLTDSFHAVFSRAFAARYPQGQVIQLHGFDVRKRKSTQAQQASIILSTGSPSTTAFLFDTQQCFIDRGWRALRYPQQVRELGATQNSIAALLRNIGHSGFIHIEMNLSTRKQLIGDKSRLNSFAGCLVGSLQ